MPFFYGVEILRTPKFKNSYAFLKRPQDLCQRSLFCVLECNVIQTLESQPMNIYLFILFYIKTPLGMQPDKLEQLERLRSEDPPPPWLSILLTSSYWIPSQNKTKWKSPNLKNLPKLQIL